MTFRGLILFAVVGAMVAVTEVPIAGQAPEEAQAAKAKRLRAEAAAAAGKMKPRPWEEALTTPWTHPRTPWGDPDIQGMWGEPERVSFERPEKFGDRTTLTDAEIAALEARYNKVSALQGQGKLVSTGFRDQANYNNIVNWGGDAWQHVSRRTSAIIDPPDGHLPAWTLDAVKRYEEREALTSTRGDADWTVDRPPGERCIATFSVTSIGNWGLGNGGVREAAPNDAANEGGQAANAGGDGQGRLNVRRFTQTPGYISITREGVSGRGEQIFNVIRLDNRAHLPKTFLQYRGSTVGRFEGNTLVVEYKNIKYYGPYIMSYGGNHHPAGKGEGNTLDTSHLTVTERYTRVGPDRMEYTVTVDDPSVYVRPYTVAQSYNLDNSFKLSPPLCKEGTDDMGLTLSGWRLDEETAMRTAAETREMRKSGLARVKARAIAEANKSKSQ